MYRLNWKPKPNAKAYRDLVFHQWWTDEQRTTDAKGACAVRGFLGQYEITVEADGKTKIIPAKLTKDGADLTVQF
jgi:hypothetical protein